MTVLKYLVKRVSTLFIASLFTFAVLAAALPAKPKEVVHLTYQNTMIIEGEMTGVSVNTWIAAMVGKRMMLPETQNLYIIINSPGGNYEDAKVLRMTISKIPNVVVICKYCASAAGYIQATSLHRLALSNSEMLMHEMFWPHATAKLVQNRSAVANLIKSSDEFNEAIYSVLGISKQEYLSKITDSEWTLDGDEMVQYHVAEKVVKLDCDAYIQYIAPKSCSAE